MAKAKAQQKSEAELVHSVEIVSVADLKPHPKNYRQHPDDQVSHLEESIGEHGFYRNVVVARDGTILAGHGVAAAAKKMGLGTIPVIRLDVDPFDDAALKVLVGDNEIARLTMNDDRALTELLKGIKESIGPDGLLGTGFNEQMLAALTFVTRPMSEIASFDAAAEWVGMPEHDSGAKAWRLTITFRSEEERATFVRETLGVEKARESKTGKEGSIISMWWPPRENDDLMSLRFDEAGAPPEGEAEKA